jgi:hypothetical protein
LDELLNGIEAYFLLDVFDVDEVPGLFEMPLEPPDVDVNDFDGPSGLVVMPDDGPSGLVVKPGDSPSGLVVMPGDGSVVEVNEPEGPGLPDVSKGLEGELGEFEGVRVFGGVSV